MSQQGNQEQAKKMYCIMCGGEIDSDSRFCYLCGAKLDADPDTSEEPKRVGKPSMSAEPKTSQQGSNKAVPTRTFRKGLIIGGICAAVLLFAVIIGATIKFLSEYQSGNVLMRVKDHAYLVEENMQNRIKTITFLNSLDTMPGDAWDVSAFGRRKVMAWVEERDDGYYDLYIGGNGGVVANKDSSYLFAYYHNVEEIQFNGNFHTEDVTDINSMFYSCGKLTSLDINGFDTSNVKDMSAMFLGCESLTNVNVSGFDTSKVTDMSQMFANCMSLTSLDVSGFDTSKVTRMIAMFGNCRNLTSLDVSGFDMSNVTDMRLMFAYCKGLTNVDLSGFDTSKVTNASEMFIDCEGLTSLGVSNFTPDQIAEMKIPEGVAVY